MADKDSLKALKKVANKKLGIKIGLHLNLVEGRSMTGKQYISSLVNQKGTFFPLWKVVTLLSLGKIDKQHIAREVTRQITLLKKAGYKVSFINSHQHLHALSPVAEIVTEIAGREKIKTVSSYKNVNTYTVSAKVKYYFLKFIAMISYLLAYQKWGLPTSWNTDDKERYSFMSWEGIKLDVLRLRDKKLVLVAHPFLPFDSNRSYIPFLI